MQKMKNVIDIWNYMGDSMGSSNIYLIKTQNKNKNGENSVQTFSNNQNMGNIWENNSWVQVA